MTIITPEQAQKLLDGATRGPWQADGDPWNRIVWSSAENRVCFMAHTNGLDDARDIATSDLVAAAPDLARQLLATMTALAEAQAAQASVVERCAAEMDLAAHIMSHHGSFQEQRAYENAAKSIRSLADPTGVKLLAELRARAEKAEALRDEVIEKYTAGADKRLADQDRAEAAEAQLAEVQKREATETARADAAEALVKGRTFTVDPIAEALAKQTSHGERQEHSRIGHALAESSWHVHLAGFVSRAHAEQALAALAQQPPTPGAGDDQGSK